MEDHEKDPNSGEGQSNEDPGAEGGQSEGGDSAGGEEEYLAVEEVLAGTSFEDPIALRDGFLEAQKKISEQGMEMSALKKQMDIMSQGFEKFFSQNQAQQPANGTGVPDNGADNGFDRGEWVEKVSSGPEVFKQLVRDILKEDKGFNSFQNNAMDAAYAEFEADPRVSVTATPEVIEEFTNLLNSDKFVQMIDNSITEDNYKHYDHDAAKDFYRDQYNATYFQAMGMAAAKGRDTGKNIKSARNQRARTFKKIRLGAMSSGGSKNQPASGGGSELDQAIAAAGRVNR